MLCCTYVKSCPSVSIRLDFFCLFGIWKLEGFLTVHLPHEIMWNANLMQQRNFIDIFLARHVSGTYVHHQEH